MGIHLLNIILFDLLIVTLVADKVRSWPVGIIAAVTSNVTVLAVYGVATFVSTLDG